MSSLNLTAPVHKIKLADSKHGQGKSVSLRLAVFHISQTGGVRSILTHAANALRYETDDSMQI